MHELLADELLGVELLGEVLLADEGHHVQGEAEQLVRARCKVVPQAVNSHEVVLTATGSGWVGFSLSTWSGWGHTALPVAAWTRLQSRTDPSPRQAAGGASSMYTGGAHL